MHYFFLFSLLFAPLPSEGAFKKDPLEEKSEDKTKDVSPYNWRRTFVLKDGSLVSHRPHKIILSEYYLVNSGDKLCVGEIKNLGRLYPFIEKNLFPDMTYNVFIAILVKLKLYEDKPGNWYECFHCIAGKIIHTPYALFMDGRKTPSWTIYYDFSPEKKTCLKKDTLVAGMAYDKFKNILVRSGQLNTSKKKQKKSFFRKKRLKFS